MGLKTAGLRLKTNIPAPKTTDLKAKAGPKSGPDRDIPAGDRFWGKAKWLILLEAQKLV